MHPEFKRLASLRSFLMRGDPRLAPDYGRESAAAWIGRHSPAVPVSVRVDALPQGAGLRIAPANPDPEHAVIYIHGGGLVYYAPRLFVPFLAQLAEQTGQTFLALDYGKAPETPAPILWHQLTQRLIMLLAAFPDRRFALAGDSVGGLLATLLCGEVASGRIDRLHLIYPVTDLRVVENDPHGRGHFLDADMMEWFYGFIRPLCANRPAPIAMSAAQLTALPPTTLHCAGADILGGQGRAFAAALQGAGRLAGLQEFTDLPHDFCLFSGSSAAARDAVLQIGATMARVPADA